MDKFLANPGLKTYQVEVNNAVAEDEQTKTMLAAKEGNLDLFWKLSESWISNPIVLSALVYYLNEFSSYSHFSGISTPLRSTDGLTRGGQAN